MQDETIKRLFEGYLKKDGLLKYLELAHLAPVDSLMTKALFQLFEKLFDNGTNPRFAGTICDPSGNVTAGPS